jgi:hypothetical protein
MSPNKYIKILEGKENYRLHRNIPKTRFRGESDMEPSNTRSSRHIHVVALSNKEDWWPFIQDLLTFDVYPPSRGNGPEHCTATRCNLLQGESIERKYNGDEQLVLDLTQVGKL